MNNFPQISVVMSVYNAEKYLNEAIDSILGQTFINFEFIIINDGSTDTSKDIITTYKDTRIVLIDQANTGLPTALNNGIRAARTKYIARMDADDVAMPERLQLQFSFLKNNPDYILIGSNAINIDRYGEFVYYSNMPTEWEIIKKRFPDSSFYHSSVMFCKDAFYKAGCYFEEISKMNCLEDSILWHNMQKYGKMTNLQEPLIKYRLVPDASTTKSGKELGEIYKIFEDIIRDQYLSAINREKLLKIKHYLNPVEKERIYYIHIAKKFLFNNFQPVKARKNLLEAIKIKLTEPYPYLLYIYSLLPNKLIKKIYAYKK